MSDSLHGQNVQQVAPSSSMPSSSSASSMNGESSQIPPRAQNGNASARSPAKLEDHSIGKRRLRHSGGFLLETTSLALSRHSSKRHTVHGLLVEKGKKKEGALEHTGSTSVSTQSGHRHKRSIGSSPLSTEVINAAQHDHHDLDRTPSTPRHRSQGSTEERKENASDDRAAKNLEPSYQSEEHGRDMNPSQIVNLALNLSESRRRHVSAGLPSPIDGSGHRRIVSAGQALPAYRSTPVMSRVGGSLRHHPQQHRRTSRHLSPKLAKADHIDGRTSGPRNTEDTSSEIVSPGLPGFGIEFVDDYIFSPSEATILRAEKARASLELSYEYRRLLQYLEELPLPQNSRPGTARSGKRPLSEIPQVLGRMYNPLQYIRNRRVRNRERMTFDAEAEGWRNVGRVRSWVDLVSSQRSGSVSAATNMSSLPTFSGDQVLNQGDSSPLIKLPSANTPSAVNVRRPKTEWITTPWDLLADAYWLDQDSNKNLIEDHEEHKIYPVLTSHIEPGLRISQDFTAPSARRSLSIPRHDQAFRINENGLRKGLERSTKERGRRQHQLRDSITSLTEPSSSQDRKSRWLRRGIRSRSSSSSDDSLTGSLNQIPWLNGPPDIRERQDSAILDRQMMSLLAAESNHISRDTQSLEKPGSALEQPPTTSAATDMAKQTMPFQNPSLGESHMSKPRVQEEHPLLHRSPHEGKRTARKRRSSERSKSLSPGHPGKAEAVLDIAIEISRDGYSARSPKKPLQSPQRVTKADIDNEQIRDTLGQGSSSVDVGMKPQFEDKKSIPQSYVSSSPTDGFLSPKSAEGYRPLRHKQSNSKSSKRQKDHGDVESRLRGMLKGPSRLAGMVGSPVSRVGDILWRRDGSNRPSNIVTPISSNASDASDSDEETSVTKRKLENFSLTNARQFDDAYPRRADHEGAPKFHVNNLPTFKSSSLKHDKDGSLFGANEHDHISWQQTESRERNRTSRFNRLAPPSLDLRSISPSPSAPLTRIETTDSDMTRDESAQRGPTDYNGRRNVGQLSNTFRPLLELPVSGLTYLEARQKSTEDRPNLAGKRQWSISDRGMSAFRESVKGQDITRVQALLLSSAVKANQIVRHSSEIPDRPLPILQEIQHGSKMPVSRASRSREHVLAARLLDQSIEDNNTRLREAANRMSNDNVNELHNRIKALNDCIMSTLTPTVRALADDADLLSSELSTTHRLSVKQVNDNLDLIIRRKRRRFRLVRRGGYLLLEWTLLGLMWWVWLIVVIVRLIRGTIAGIFSAVKWFLWL